MRYFGEYGGRCLRKFSGGGKTFIPGAELSAEEVESWPIANRRALFNTHKVEWYGQPIENSKKEVEEVKEKRETKKKDDVGTKQVDAGKEKSNKQEESKAKEVQKASKKAGKGRRNK